MNSWLTVLRIPTLTLACLPVMSAAYLAKRDGEISIILLANILLSAIIIQIISNLANDYFDFSSGDDKNLKDRSKVLYDGLINLEQLKILLISLTISCLVVSLPLVEIGGLPIIIIGLSALFMAFLYSYSSFSLAKNFLAELTAFIYFGPLASWGSYYLLSNQQSNLQALLIGIPAGIISINLLTINNWRDYTADRISGRKNLVQLLGFKNTNNYFQGALFILCLLYLKLLHYPLNIIGFFVLLVPVAYQIELLKKDQINFKELFKSTIRLAIFLQLLFITNCFTPIILQ